MKELITDLFSVPKTKEDWFWKGLVIGCVIGMGIALLALLN
ncbi:hypothetical protein [Phocaeicola sp.]|jgi:hypothetical protein